MDMKPHVNTVIGACYHQIRSIAKMRKYLSMDSASKLIHVFVTSRLDNLNSLLVELLTMSLMQTRSYFLYLRWQVPVSFQVQ